jgi:hypothetical protein
MRQRGAQGALNKCARSLVTVDSSPERGGLVRISDGFACGVHVCVLLPRHAIVAAEHHELILNVQLCMLRAEDPLLVVSMCIGMRWLAPDQSGL